MIILGENKDDKGTQLEQLTEIILNRKGFTNIVTNEIGSGGKEIDVTAEQVIFGFQSPTTRRVICECKAHEKSITIGDWLRFIGKVYGEELRLGGPVLGCFIALSGVNGNVSGDYEYIKSKRPIELITGDNLNDLISDLFNVVKISDIHKALNMLTERSFTKIELAYYNRDVFWIVLFENGAYTLLDKQGNLFDITKLNQLRKLVDIRFESYIFINIQDETAARIRVHHLEKNILCLLFSHDGEIKKDELSNELLHIFKQDEINLAINNFIESHWIVDEEVQIRFYNTNEEFYYPKMVNVLLYLFNSPVASLTELIKPGLLSVIDSSYYDALINNELLEEILKIQKNIQLTDEETRELIKVLKWSPTALSRLIKPIGMIVNSISNDIPIDERLNRHHVNYLMNLAYSYLHKDFINRNLSKYLYEKHGLRKIFVKREFIIELESQEIISKISKEANSISPADESLGGGYLPILLIDDEQN